jgi:hypothetical protein
MQDPQGHEKNLIIGLVDTNCEYVVISPSF